jgi:hypothetical protein
MGEGGGNGKGGKQKEKGLKRQAMQAASSAGADDALLTV